MREYRIDFFTDWRCDCLFRRVYRLFDSYDDARRYAQQEVDTDRRLKGAEIMLTQQARIPV